MAERVEILVLAKDSASQILRGVAGSFGSINSAVSNLTSGMALEALTSEIIKFGKESIEATVEYANEVRNLSMISGESAESTSRFIQVLDDYKISSDDAMAATRKLTENGLSPNIQTLAQLSDQYLSLNTVEERNKFVLDNLGRAGTKWVEVLNKGSDAILAQGEAVADGLILNQKQLDQARELEIAQDVMNESYEQLSLTVGTKLIPVVTQSIDEFNNTTRAIEIMREKGLNPTWEMLVSGDGYIEALRQAGEETKAQREAMLQNAEGANLMADAHGKTTEELKAEEEAVKNLTKANQDELSTLGNLTSTITDYRQKEADLKGEHDELIAKKAELIAQGYLPESEAILDINQKLAENQIAQQQNTEVFQLETNKRILARAEELLSIDGLTTAEKEGLIERGIAMGVYTTEAAARMHEEEQAALDLAASLNDIPTEINTDVNVFFHDYYDEGFTDPGGVFHGHAGGGGVSVGTMYRVNETRQEYFKPSMSGEVIPLGGGDSRVGGAGGINVVLQPMIMAGDRNNALNVLMPMIIEGIRKARADRII